MVHRRILVLALLVAVAEARAEVGLETPHITVNGTATVQVVPNEMLWQLNVRNVAPASEAAAEIHGTIVGKLMAFLKQSQIPAETIQTSRMQLGENWTFKMGDRVQDGYAASTDVQFKLTDFTKYVPLWMGLSAIQGVQIRDVLLDRSDRVKYQNEARTKAVLAARDKARALAETIGSRLGEPLAVEEDLSAADGYRVPSAMTNANVVVPQASPDSMDESPLAPGTIPVRARVKASFRLLPK
jgi:uncharacterized protein YggE